jgi:hypothetical protein
MISVLRLVVASALASASPAVAATITALDTTYSLASGTGNTNVDQTVLFALPQFDPSLGTLSAIEISLFRSEVGTTVSIDSESPFQAAAFPGDVTAATFLTLGYFGGTLLASQNSGAVGPNFGFVLGVDSDGVPDFQGGDAFDFIGVIPSDAPDAIVTDAATLAAFTGSGALLLTLDTKRLAGSTIPGVQSIQASYGGAFGFLTVDYEFTREPRNVPEPGTSVLLASAVALLSRRRALQRLSA